MIKSGTFVRTLLCKSDEVEGKVNAYLEINTNIDIQQMIVKHTPDNNLREVCLALQKRC